MTTIYAADRVIDSLAPFATIPEWLAVAMTPDRVADSLRRHVPELASGQVTLDGCTADRLRAKATEWLARYTLHLKGPDGTQN